MLYLLIGLAAGVILTSATLWPRIARNSRRIDRLERRQRAHGFVIRHLTEESVDPDEPPPGHRGDARIFKGAAGIGVVALLARRHPVSTVLAAAGAATAAAVLAVTLTPMQARGGPGVSGLPAPSGAVASYSAPVAVPSSSPARPSASVSVAAPASAMPVAGTSGPTVAAAHPTPGQPLLAVSLPPVKASVVLPPVSVPVLPTGSLLPSLPVTLPSTPAPSPSPSVRSSRACVVDLRLPPALRACVL